MSAFTQNYIYDFGKKKPDAKEPMVPKERIEKVRETTERYLEKKRYENPA